MKSTPELQAYHTVQVFIECFAHNRYTRYVQGLNTNCTTRTVQHNNPLNIFCMHFNNKYWKEAILLSQNQPFNSSIVEQLTTYTADTCVQAYLEHLGG